MKNLKLFLLIGIFAFAFGVKSQTVTVYIDEPTTYTGLYDVNLFVLDNFAQTYTHVGQKKDQPTIVYFLDTDIDLSSVNIVSDQVDRYRYVAVVTRQEASGSGQGWTPLLDTGDMWNHYDVDVQMH